MPSSADPPVADGRVTAAAAGRWRLGDHDVARLGFGTMRLTGTLPFHGGEPRDRDTSVAVLRRAVELGADHLDSAAFYFSRTLSANQLVVEALKPYPSGLVIATKVGPARDAAGEWADSADPDGVRGQVEENLRALGLDRLAVVNFRAAPGLEVSPYVEALARLVAEGLVGHVGVSAVDADQLDAARRVVEVVCVQNRSDDARMLRRCAELGIAFVPFFAVSAGGHQGRPSPQSEPELAVTRETGASPAQVRLVRSLAGGEHVLVIPGTGSVAHLEDNVAAAALRLTEDQLARLSGS